MTSQAGGCSALGLGRHVESGAELLLNLAHHFPHQLPITLADNWDEANR